MKILMKLISVLFHPLLMATYTLIVFYYYTPELFSPVSFSAIPIVLFATFLTTFLIPLLSILLMKMTSRVSSLELSKREERILPFISISLFYGAATYMFFEKLKLSPPLTTTMIIVTALIVILSLITLKFKISIHAAASWGVVGLLIALSMRITGSGLFLPVVISILAAGLVASSRLFLQLHTPKEIWSGSFLGFIFTFLGLWFFS